MCAEGGEPLPVRLFGGADFTFDERLELKTLREYRIASYEFRSGIVGGSFCAPEGSRTPNPQLRRLMLYPIELQALVFLT